MFKKKLSSLHVPHNKNTANMASVKLAAPREVLIPLSGAAAVVEAGDTVKVGQLIGREEGRNSVVVHSSVSGTVVGVEDYNLGDRPDKAVRIKNDGCMTVYEDLKAPEITDLDSFLAALRASGVVGLGGAAFPLWAKFDAVRRSKVKTVLVNGAECEPYMTADDRMMREHADLIHDGLVLYKKFLGVENFVIGIEKNKPEAIEILGKALADLDYVSIMPLESVYPQGAKQVFLYNVAGLAPKEGQRLAALGYLITNISSLAKSAEYLLTGMPMVSRIVTVDGNAIKKPGNFEVPLGTPISSLLEACGGLTAEEIKLIIGGPMMGKTTASADTVVGKVTGGVLAFAQAKPDAEPQDCIHCGRCANTCPLMLNPTVFERAMEIEDEEERYRVLSRNYAGLCMKCGCCAYVCPAHRPLVVTNGKAMSFLKKTEADRKAAAAAREGGKA